MIFCVCKLLSSWLIMRMNLSPCESGEFISWQVRALLSAWADECRGRQVGGLANW